jgi:hypothetical protein
LVEFRIFRPPGLIRVENAGAQPKREDGKVGRSKDVIGLRIEVNTEILP